MEWLDIIDENDEVVGSAERREVYLHGHRHRIVHIWVTNDEGEIALQKRSRHCAYCPLHWDVAAAGHVASGEVQKEAALRELQEEIGLTAEITLLSKEPYQGENAPALISIYHARHNGEFVVDPAEVDHVRWVTIEEVARMVDSGELFTPQFVHVFNRYFSN